MLVIFSILILSPEFKLCGSSVVIVITGDEYDAPIIIFGFLSVLGLVIGLGVYVPLFISVDSPVADVINHAIHYNVSGSTIFQFVPVLLWEAMYIAIIASPLFASNSRKILYLGIAIVLSAAVSYLIFWFAFTSVWCFFAALLSLYLCIVFRNLPPLTFKQQNS